MSTLSERTISVPSIATGPDGFTDDELNREYHHKQEYLEAIDKYGCIFKVVSFSDISDVAALKRHAREWIRRNYFDGVLSFTIKAVDLHLLGYNADQLLCGDRIQVEFLDTYKTKVTKTLTCLSVQYDILNPQNTSYKIGIPEVSSNVKYRDSLRKQSSSAKKKDDNKNKNLEDVDDHLKPKWQTLGQLLGLSLDDESE